MYVHRTTVPFAHPCSCQETCALNIFLLLTVQADVHEATLPLVQNSLGNGAQATQCIATSAGVW